MAALLGINVDKTISLTFVMGAALAAVAGLLFMKEVLYEGINIGEKDFSALVSKIKASGADLVYWGGLHTEGGLIVRQMRDQGVKAPLMGGDGITTDEFAQVGGPGVVGTLMTYGPDARKNPAAKKVVDEFRAKKFEPEAYTLYS